MPDDLNWLVDSLPPTCERALTIGRQHLYATPTQARDAWVGRHGTLPASIDNGHFETDRWTHADPFFELFGAKVDSMDVSDYEGASIIHDLNTPVPQALHESFDLIVDGGTLEHVFNFPSAIENLMTMTRVGGHLALILPANNYCGHGFYQFSPELFFRMFTEENGFSMHQMILGENFRYTGPRWYDTNDPEAARARANLVNGTPTLAYVLARRDEVRPLFETLPYQSDYVEEWRGTGNEQRRTKALYQRLLASAPNVANGLRGTHWKHIDGTFRNRRIYTRRESTRR